MNTKALQKDPFHKELWSLVLPITIQSFMLALVSATDAVMLGLIDQPSMASVSQAGQIQFFLNLLVTGFSIGIGIMAAQYWGKRDAASIEKVAPSGLLIVLAIGGTMTLAALFFPRWLMSILTNDAVLIPLGAGYLRMVAPSYLLCGISQMYFSLLKNTGHAAKSSAISCLAVVLNIILNALLIFGLFGLPEMGIEGAALATVISRLVELVLAWYFNVRQGHVQLRWKGLLEKPDRLLFGDFLHYTTPVIGASLVWGVAYMLYSIILGHMGGDAVAANSIVSIARNLISCVIRGVGAGAGIMVGNILGAGELDKAKAYGARLTKLAAIVGFATGLCLIAAGPLMHRMVDLTETAASYMQFMLVFCAINLCAQSINHVVLDGIFGAGGDAKFDMDTNIWDMWFVCVPLGFLAAFWLKLPAPVVYCIVNMDEIIKLPAVFLHYRKYVWLRDITR